MPRAEPIMGFDLVTQRSWCELKPRVRCLSSIRQTAWSFCSLIHQACPNLRHLTCWVFSRNILPMGLPKVDSFSFIQSLFYSATSSNIASSEMSSLSTQSDMAPLPNPHPHWLQNWLRQLICLISYASLSDTHPSGSFSCKRGQYSQIEYEVSLTKWTWIAMPSYLKKPHD